MPVGEGYTFTSDIDVNEILYGTILPAIEVYNEEEVLDLRALFCQDATEKYSKFVANDRWLFQKLGEGDKPDSKKLIYGKRQKDTEKFGLGLGYTYDWLISDESSEEEIVKKAKEAISRDRTLQTAVILNTMVKSSTDGFFNAVFSTEEKMTAPLSYGSKSFATTHSHYVAAGSTTLALSYITAAKEHIKEHGYKGQIWGFANSDFMKKVEDLAGWAALSSSSFVISNPIVDRVAVEGFAGKLLGINWRETEFMPDGYFMLVGMGDLKEKPVRYIQKAKKMGQGLKLFEGPSDFPLVDSYYCHWLASQVLLRGAGVVYYLGTTWADPDVTSLVYG